MFRDIFSGSRAIFIGLVFFLLVVGGSLLYSWHVHRTTDAEVAETQRKVQPLENKNEPRTAADTVDTSKVDFGQTETPLETNDTQPMSDETEVFTDDEAENVDLTDAFLPEDFVSEEESAEVPVSPFGFGPYPEVPADYPSTVIWERTNHGDLTEGTLTDLELLDRVLVKLWSEGERGFKGGVISGNKVYPHYHNTAYVRFKVDSEGHRYISRFRGGPDLPRLTREQMRTGKIPDGIRVIDLDSAGIDAYRFLNSR